MIASPIVCIHVLSLHINSFILARVPIPYSHALTLRFESVAIEKARLGSVVPGASAALPRGLLIASLTLQDEPCALARAFVIGSTEYLRRKLGAAVGIS